MSDYRIKFERYSDRLEGWVVYFKGARMWKKPSLSEALRYVQNSLHYSHSRSWGTSSRAPK